ncbi:MAG: transglycosylase SLT domain-containing protein [Pseudomonadota bacterium]
MTTAQSVIEIDVRDEAFKEFQASFEKYQQKVKDLPGAWGKVGKSAEDALKKAKKNSEDVADAWANFKINTGPFSKIRKELRDIRVLSDKAATPQERFRVAAIGTSKTFGLIAQSSGKLAANIKNVTLNLLKWASLTSVFSGLLGAGGLFGLDRLARSAGDSRRESQGLGVTPGERSAANINFQKLVDVDTMLARIQEARTDVTKRWTLSAAGVNPADIEGKSNADVLKMLIPALKRTYERSGSTLQGAEAHGLTQFADISTLTRLKAVQQQEIDVATALYEKDKQALAISDKTQAAWQTFANQLDRAGQKIENVFLNKLASLTGPLTELSDAFAGAVKVFLDSPKIGTWIRGLGVEIQKFTKYLVSDDFSSDVKRFVDSLDTAAGWLYSFAKGIQKLLSYLPGVSETSLKKSQYDKLETLEKLSPDLAHALKYKLENPNASAADRLVHKASDSRIREAVEEANKGSNKDAIAALLRDLTGNNDAKLSPQYGFGKIKNPDGSVITPDAVRTFSSAAANASNKFSDLETKYKLPFGLLESVRKQESGGDVNAVSPKGAIGPFQFMPKTAEQYGIKDARDEGQSAEGAARMYSDLLRKYGSVDKALAGYNWGQGNLDKYGMDKAPKETRDYIQKITADMGRRQTSSSGIDMSSAPAVVQQRQAMNNGPQAVTVNIYKAAGADVFTTVNGLPQ